MTAPGRAAGDRRQRRRVGAAARENSLPAEHVEIGEIVRALAAELDRARARTVAHGRAAPALHHRDEEADVDARCASMLARVTASLCGMCCWSSSLKRSRVGSATPSPKANTSRVPSEGTKPISEPAASDTAERTIAWSRSFAMRIANSVEHCEMMVASSSAGRCVISPRNTPYLRPSLAMRDTALRVGPKPIVRSAGA